VQVQLTRRYAGGWSAQASYTLGESFDEGSDVQVGGLPVDARDLGREWGPSDFDVRHRFVASALYEVPWLKDSAGLTRALFGGWQVNGIVCCRAVPFSVFTSRTYGNGGDFNGDGVNNDRPGCRRSAPIPATWADDYINGAPRRPTSSLRVRARRPAAQRVPRAGAVSMDLSLIKNSSSTATRIQFRAEAFNVLNWVNPAAQRQPAQATFTGRRSRCPREVQPSS
jgi:hypothetical protein